MAAGKQYFAISLLIFFLISVCCLPEPGKKELHFKKNQTFNFFAKTMNKGYSVAIKGNCKGVDKINITWRLDVSQCAESFSFLKTSDQLKLGYLFDDSGQEFSAFSLNGEQEEVKCNAAIHLKDLTHKVKEWIIDTTTEKPTESKAKTKEGKENSPPSKQTESKSETKEEKGKSPSSKQTSKDDSTPSNGRDENSNDKTEETSKQTQAQLASKQSQRRRRDEKENKESNQASNSVETNTGTSSDVGTSSDAENGDMDPEVEEMLNKPAPATTEGEEDTADQTNKAEEASKLSEKPGKKTTPDAESQASNPGPNKMGKQTSSDTEKKASNSVPKKTGKQTSSDAEKVNNRVCATLRDGVFLLIVKAESSGVKKDKDFELTLNVEMKGQHGYLSASDWPLYPFYGCMSLLYVFYGIVWLIVSACQWRDLLRIQFWIGGVIALGMLEKAVFFSEYNNINITGETSPSLTVFAELVSCVKRTLARILVIIVSMGFGIVKPRLGTTLHRVLGVGALYFILATIEGCFRSLHPKSDPGKQQLIASIPLAVLDASICWWIFMSLVQTTRTLRIRRNLVKLSLYRHFTNTLIFAVLASVAYMIWSIKTHRFAKNGCITDWSELWLDEAFWHFLFSIVLLVIMVLWRPTANNQRYAFTPIVDFGDDDDDDENMTLSDAFDGMKMRNVKNTPEVIINGDTKRKHKPEDDLKWVEENIPSSAADAVLPSVLDSDEELMTTKFEMSKME